MIHEVVSAVATHHYALHWLSHILGFDNLSGPFYGFWSGFGSDLGEISILGGIVVAWHHLNCHEPSCKKIGRYTLMTPDGQHHRICKKHHPDDRIRQGTHSISHIVKKRT